ncbi:hypothetical protein AYO38_06325 [bacterium SCGC AG-212-C10]|nr:hypothetical protein AYO38_06325 [bacterium SCGC AG-212-C10]
MGRRKNRKRERQAEHRHPRPAWNFAPPPDPAIDLFLEDEFLGGFDFPHNRRADAPAIPMCGGCQEFIEDAEGGRGTCLHPGSGILSPWTDTPGCPFHTRKRR